MLRSLAFSFLMAVLPCAAAWATTLAPMSEDEQIEAAAVIFRGRADEVVAVRETTPNGHAIVTTVRFSRLATYKGAPAEAISLRFLGGKVGDVEMKVDGMPTFAAGREYILFVSDAKNLACPVVGWSEGSLRVDRGSDARGEVIRPSRVGSAAENSAAEARRREVPAGDRALPEFERRLRARINALSDRP